MLEQFWTKNSTKSRSHNKNKTSNLISTNKLRQSKKRFTDNRTEQLITYESTFVQGGYTTFVTVPSGECFANPKRCKNVNNSRQHAARVALVHCMFGGAKTPNVKTCNSSKKLLSQPAMQATSETERIQRISVRNRKELKGISFRNTLVLH